MGPKTFKKIVDHLFPIRKRFQHKTPPPGFGLGGIVGASNYWGEAFDYPDYGGLPKSISYKLSPEAVDALQYIIRIKFNRKRDFARAYKNRLEELGERGWHKLKVK